MHRRVGTGRVPYYPSVRGPVCSPVVSCDEQFNYWGTAVRGLTTATSHGWLGQSSGWCLYDCLSPPTARDEIYYSQTSESQSALIDGCRYLHVYTRLSSVNIRPDHEDVTERSHFSLYVRTRSHYLCPASYFALSRYPRIWSLHWTEHNYLTFWISCKQLITIIRSA